MRAVFAITLQEGAEAARCDSCPSFINDWQPMAIGMWVGILVGLTIIIGLAFFFANQIRKKIRNRDTFSGMAYGFIYGLLGIGIITTTIACIYINQELKRTKIQNKPYYKLQMKNFYKSYAFCVIAWVVILVIINIARNNYNF